MASVIELLSKLDLGVVSKRLISDICSGKSLSSPDVLNDRESAEVFMVFAIISYYCGVPLEDPSYVTVSLLLLYNNDISLVSDYINEYIRLISDEITFYPHREVKKYGNTMNNIANKPVKQILVDLLLFTIVFRREHNAKKDNKIMCV